jgi:protein-S-isoprenylcysteine O-methyltransferase Ste14
MTAFILPGKIMLVLAVLLFAWTQIVLFQNGTTVEHTQPTTKLIRTGPFQFTRNPIYVAMSVVLAGLALAYGNVWGLILLVPFVIAMDHCTIRLEENYLAREFGGDYTSYRNAVRRWI